MLLFLDTAKVDEIGDLAFLLDGVTTTPTIIKKAGLKSTNFITTVRNTFPNLEIHIEALANDAKSLEKLVKDYCSKSWYDSDKIVFKIPISLDGLNVTKRLRLHNPSIRINLHLIFSAAQAFLAMIAEPDYITPLIGRYKDQVASMSPNDVFSQEAEPGYMMLDSIIKCKSGARSQACILASSIRTVHDMVAAAKMGAGGITVSPAILKESIQHPMTNDGLKKLWDDWDKI
jgi:transaldolase